MKQVLTVEPYVTGTHRLFGATTLLMDRVVPMPERIELPPATSKGGTITIETQAGDRLPSTRAGLRALRHRFRPDRAPSPVDGPIVDLRAHSPQNWSHALMMHLPLASAAAGVLGRDPVAILPFNTPGFVRAAFQLCGIRTLATDHAVAGSVCAVTCSDWDMLKQATGPFMRQRAARIHAAVDPAAPPLPRRIFVARKGSREVTNQAEVEAVLHPLGYATVYPERLSIVDQFRLFNEATHIVGIHGAGLSPVSYRDPDRDPPVFVELFSPPLVNSFFRVVFDQLGARYAGVRGRLSPADVRAAYKAEPYYTNAAEPFWVDPESLRLALAEVGADRR